MLKINRKKLLENLKILKTTKPTKVAAPANFLNFVMFSQNENELEMITTDQDNSYKISQQIDEIKNNVNEFCINFDFLLKTATAIKDEYIFITDNKIINESKTNNFCFKIDEEDKKNAHGLKGNDIIRFNKNIVKHSAKVPAYDFIKAIKRAVNYSSKDETRYFINGVLLEFTKNEDKLLKVVSTNGHMLSIGEVLNCESDGDFNIHMTNETVKALLALKSKAKDISRFYIEIFENNQYCITFQNIKLKANQLPSEGKYPDYKNVPAVKYKEDNDYRIKKDDIVNSLEQALVITNDKHNSIALHLKNNNLNIKAKNFDNDTSIEFNIPIFGINVDKDAEYKFGLNCKYFLQIIQDTDGGCFFLELNSSTAIIKGVNFECYLCLIRI
jgi:DNA polymerase III sliding clamp (beta) subunit (PCNA family)